MDKLSELRKQNKSLSVLASALIGCGYRDVDIILEMENNFPGTIDEAIYYAEELETNITFSDFVRAIKRKAIQKIEGLIPQEVKDGLMDMIIDANYSAWRRIKVYGYHCEKEIQEQFINWLTTGNDKYKEKILNLCQKYYDYQEV